MNEMIHLAVQCSCRRCLVNSSIWRNTSGKLLRNGERRRNSKCRDWGGGGGVGGEGGEFLDSAPRGFSPSSPSPENQPTLYDLL